ncbi:MAG: hypothetical protein AAGD04_14855 [Pseudomonadota bacterium]
MTLEFEYFLLGKVRAALLAFSCAVCPVNTQAGGHEAALSWMERCLGTVDAVYESEDKPEHGLSQMLEQTCVVSGFDYCRFEAEPRLCLSDWQSEVKTRTKDLVADLPEKVAGAGFMRNSLNKEIERLRASVDIPCTAQIHAVQTLPFSTLDFCTFFEAATRFLSARDVSRRIERLN